MRPLRKSILELILFLEVEKRGERITDVDIVQTTGIYFLVFKNIVKGGEYPSS